jgi:hypothetical protein
MRHVHAAALLLALVTACSGDLCAPGDSEPCTCASGASGRAPCDPAGDGFGACDCGAAACPPGASHRCEGSELFAIDACGNRDPVPARVCACACAEGATACPDWEEPPALRAAAGCTDRTACLRMEDVHCELDSDGLWKHGQRVTNACDEPIRCYVYQYRSVVYPISGGWMTMVGSGCIAPPGLPALDAGQSIYGWEGHATEEACRERWDSSRATEFAYHVCVRADDPVETCLPGVTVAQGIADCSPLEPVCR